MRVTAGGGARGGTRREVRTVLYMGTLSAVRFNPARKRLYERLKSEGKVSKVALTACSWELLTILNAMVRDRARWDASKTPQIG